MVENIKGHVLIVSAPTGSGKGTLIKRALATFPNLHETVSCTTRSLRPGEANGRDYHFLSQVEFEQRKSSGDFLEWARFGNNQYGTLKEEIIPRLQAGEVVITEIEIQGVEQLRALIPKEHMTTVFIDAGSWETLKLRAIARAPISEEELNHRYERYLVEVGTKDTADVIIDNTGSDFTAAKDDFCRLIESIYALKYTN
jgi:guanylate kinase